MDILYPRVARRRRLPWAVLFNRFAVLFAECNSPAPGRELEPSLLDTRQNCQRPRDKTRYPEINFRAIFDHPPGMLALQRTRLRSYWAWRYKFKLLKRLLSSVCPRFLPHSEFSESGSKPLEPRSEFSECHSKRLDRLSEFSECGSKRLDRPSGFSEWDSKGLDRLSGFSECDSKHLDRLSGFFRQAFGIFRMRF